MRFLFFGLLLTLPALSYTQTVGKISGSAKMSPGDVPVAGAKITLLNQGAAITRVATNDEVPI